MIPTRRVFALGLAPLALILAGQGAAWSVSGAWIILSAVLAGFLFDGLLASRMRRKLAFERQTPAQLYVEQSQRISWTVENRNDGDVLLRLRDMLPQSGRAIPDFVEAAVPARSRSVLAYELRVAARGTPAFGDAVCRVRGPLRLTWRQFRVPASRDIRVLPRLANWKASELAARKALVRQVGSHRYRWRGSGTLFQSLREYSSQDDIRWLDWKATARLQRPVSRNYEVERHQHVVLLVDSSRMMTTYCGERTKFDAVLEAALLITRSAIEQGDAVGLVLFSDQVDAFLAPRHDQKQSTLIMETLFSRYPRLVEPDFETALTRATRGVQRRSLLVLFTDVTVIEAAQRMLRYVQMIGRRHLCLVVTIADESLQQQELVEPRTADELYRVGVASQLMLERAELLARLKRGGAEVLDCPADQIATRTIERYLDLKRRLRL